MLLTVWYNKLVTISFFSICFRYVGVFTSFQALGYRDNLQK